MIVVRISDGLGNQMFQYAFGRALSLKHGVSLHLDVSNFDSKKEKREYSLDKFPIHAKTVLKTQLFFIRAFYFLSGKFFKERTPRFSTDISKQTSGFFKGHWQSEKYFREYTEIIRKDFGVIVTNKNGLVMKDSIEKSIETPVSIHIRRGDYALNGHLTKKHGLIAISYYKEALAYITNQIGNNIHVFVFSDDIAWVKDNLHLENIPMTYVSGNNIPPEEELLLMSSCKHHVIANSSYSWWGAWLNPHTDKIIIAPKKWYASGIDSDDLIPENWIRM